MRGRHRASRPQLRAFRRVVATLSAALLMIGTTAGAATADVPDVPSVDVTRIAPVDEVTRLVQAAAGLAAGCVAPEGLCTAAVETVTDAVRTAQSCAEAMASEAGVSEGVAAAMQRVSLDCAEVVRLMVSLAEFAVSVANDCTSERLAVCYAVFDAARLGMDRAAGCLAAVLPSGTGVAGTDPGCAAAIAMLWREAEGVLAMLSGCLNGSNMLCEQAREHAEFARSGLTGCVGQVLWVAPSEVQAVPGEGPLPCYAVLDQVLVSINALLGQVPDLPTQITPTNEPEECSITVAAAMPTVQLSDPTLTTDHYHADSFVPSCDEPESLHTVSNVETPGVAGDLIGPYCEPRTEYAIDKVKRDGTAYKWHNIIINRNTSKPIGWDVEETVTTSLSAKITTGAEGEMNVWVAKVKATITTEASATREWTHKVAVHGELAAGREGHIASVGFTKVVEGRKITTYDNCNTKSEFRRIRVPYKDTLDVWEQTHSS